MGAAPIEAVAAAAEAQGARRHYWTTERDKAPAWQLYDRLARLAPFVKYARPYDVRPRRIHRPRIATTYPCVSRKGGTPPCFSTAPGPAL